LHSQVFVPLQGFLLNAGPTDSTRRCKENCKRHRQQEIPQTSDIH
jgi:hypothetical protein